MPTRYLASQICGEEIGYPAGVHFLESQVLCWDEGEWRGTGVLAYGAVKPFQTTIH
jgi:hypothetical protein